MRVIDFIRLIERFSAVLVFLLMVALYFINVLVRQFGGPLASEFVWIEETVRLMNLFLVFVSVGLVLERGRHAGVHTWRDKIAARTHLPLRKIIDAVGFAFCVYLVWISCQMSAAVYSMGQRSPTLNIPVFWIYLLPAMGFALMGLRYVLSFFGLIDRFSPQMAEEA